MSACNIDACACRECMQKKILVAEVRKIVSDSAYGREGHVLWRLNVLLYRFDHYLLTLDGDNTALPTGVADKAR